MTGRLVFFLGGHDLEMVTIRDLLEAHAPGRFHDKDLRWGAKASAYQAEIEGALARGETLVLVELEDDLGPSQRAVVVVDHHAERAGGDPPTSLRQIFDLLGLGPDRWTRELELVAANDSGYIPGLLAAGASRDEIERLRAADRAAQGVTAEEEAEAERAARAAERLCAGRLTLARMPRARLAPVEDRLHTALGGPGVENLLVVSPTELSFSGEGWIVRELVKLFPEGFWGGALPARGYWGLAGKGLEVLPTVVACLESLLGDGAPRLTRSMRADPSKTSD